MSDETELAWAAGFLEGEGSVTGTMKNGFFYPNVAVTQSGSPALLERFQRAVGVGKVTGPYPRPENKWAKTAKWQYQAYGPKMFVVMELLSPYLMSDGPKIEKYREIIRRMREENSFHRYEELMIFGA